VTAHFQLCRGIGEEITPGTSNISLHILCTNALVVYFNVLVRRVHPSRLVSFLSHDDGERVSPSSFNTAGILLFLSVSRPGGGGTPPATHVFVPMPGG